MTAIETKPPSGSWHSGVMDFIPGLRGKAGHIVGISDFTPRLFFRGPIVKNKLNFSDAFTYNVRRKSPVRGLGWPGRSHESRAVDFDALGGVVGYLVSFNGDVTISVLWSTTLIADENPRGVHTTRGLG